MRILPHHWRWFFCREQETGQDRVELDRVVPSRALESDRAGLGRALEPGLAGLGRAPNRGLGHPLEGLCEAEIHPEPEWNPGWTSKWAEWTSTAWIFPVTRKQGGRDPGPETEGKSVFEREPALHFFFRERCFPSLSTHWIMRLILRR